ncbi:putative X-Pro aminopeptidase [Kockovaella imperatae]|uniref:Putative X-Pro aminopeptidase n=1 Tax=Kockovaella imperatae TaxID=4999 RepID=A0A1Y1U9M5_9TREE|nr:putative X-Pro aminopeptidase [Kockovaella imperatae]ORX34207.1 putative X-Pro aminopeptidase [Kockovaella imperatae]
MSSGIQQRSLLRQMQRACQGSSSSGLRQRSEQPELPCRPSRAAYQSYSTSLSASKPPKHGQPLRSTHPHLIREGELTPGITAQEYEDRRRKLMKALPEGSVVICMAGTVRLMSQSIFYKFRQATDFYYLSGFHEPDATLVLESDPSSSRGYEYTLFVAPKDHETEQWEGNVTGLDDAVKIFGADEAKSIRSLGTFLPTYLSKSNVYASLPPLPSPSSASKPPHPSTSKRTPSLLRFLSSNRGGSSTHEAPHVLIASALTAETAKPLEKEVHRLRMIKSLAERALMKRAADLSSAAFVEVMKAAKPGISEATLAAIFEFECALGGSERPAYVPVVASGPNSLVIHYTKNDCLVDDNDLVLMDAGCEYAMYASDVTRTFPASGRFTSPQRDLYEAVLTAQKGLIKACELEAKLSLNELQRMACASLETELKQIGFKIGRGDVQHRLYPHFIAHHLGSDLHDCPTADRQAPLVDGNVITIEPGVYVPADSDFPKHFHGLGVRIEDDIALTSDGPYILSANAPKEVVDVEAACQAII